MMKLLRLVTVLSLVAVLGGMLGNRGVQAAPTGQSALPAEVLQTTWILEYLSTDDKAAGKTLSCRGSASNSRPMAPWPGLRAATTIPAPIPSPART